MRKTRRTIKTKTRAKRRAKRVRKRMKRARKRMKRKRRKRRRMKQMVAPKPRRLAIRCFFQFQKMMRDMFRRETATSICPTTMVGVIRQGQRPEYLGGDRRAGKRREV